MGEIVARGNLNTPARKFSVFQIESIGNGSPVTTTGGFPKSVADEPTARLIVLSYMGASSYKLP